MSKLAAVVAIVAVFVSPSFGEVCWVMASSHYHTPYSDGGRVTLDIGKMAHEGGSRFCVVTDHIEMLRSEKTAKWQDQKLKGVDGWITDFESAASTLRSEGLEMVPGGEGTLGVSVTGVGVSHVLMVGGKPDAYRRMEKIIVQGGDPEMVIGDLRQLADEVGAKLIAAHPICSLYPFDRKLLRYVQAIEVFDGFEDPLQELRVVASHPDAKDLPVAIVTGSDYHGDTVTAAITRFDAAGKAVKFNVVMAQRIANSLHRHVWLPVSSPAATGEELSAAIGSGSTYAAITPARIVEMSTLPGGQHDTRNKLSVALEGMNWILGKSVHCLLVRRGDGKTQEWDIPIEINASGKGNFAVDFAKPPPITLQKGSFLYLLVANQLATSGIELLPRPDIVLEKKKGFLDKLAGFAEEVLASGLLGSGTTAKDDRGSGGFTISLPRAEGSTPSYQPAPPAPSSNSVPSVSAMGTYSAGFALEGVSGFVRFVLFANTAAEITVVAGGSQWRAVVPAQYPPGTLGPNDVRWVFRSSGGQPFGSSRGSCIFKEVTVSGSGGAQDGHPRLYYYCRPRFGRQGESSYDFTSNVLTLRRQ